MDRGGTRSILKTHFEKEDLEGKTFSLPWDSFCYAFLKYFKEKYEVCHNLENCDSWYQSNGELVSCRYDFFNTT